MPRFRERAFAAAALAGVFTLPCAFAANAPAGPCSLLPAAEAAKAVGHAVDPPESKVAPRPYKDTVQGTDCVYHRKGTRGSLLFRIYFDHSAAESTDLFKRLSMFYGSSTSVPAGDEAYLDKSHALHARKGNVRFFLEVSGVDGRQDKQLTSLGAGIAGRL